MKYFYSFLFEVFLPILQFLLVGTNTLPLTEGERRERLDVCISNTYSFGNSLKGIFLNKGRPEVNGHVHDLLVALFHLK